MDQEQEQERAFYRSGHYYWNEGFVSGSYVIVFDGDDTLPLVEFVPVDIANANMTKTNPANRTVLLGRWAVILRRWRVVEHDGASVPSLICESRAFGVANTLDDCERAVNLWEDYLLAYLSASIESWVESAIYATVATELVDQLVHGSFSS